MATKNYWFGHNIDLAISGKGKHFSGISKVNYSGTANPFTGTETTTFIANSESKTGTNGWDSTNQTSDSAITTTPRFTAIGSTSTDAGTAASKTYAAGTVGFSVTWKNGGTSDVHNLSDDILLCREATKVDTLAKLGTATSVKTEYWTDETMPTISLLASATDVTGASPYVTAPYGTITSSDSSLLSVDTTASTNSTTTTLHTSSTDTAIPGIKTVTFSATTDYAETPNTKVAASTAITANTTTITLKQAADHITVNNDGVSDGVSATSAYLDVYLTTASTDYKVVDYTVDVPTGSPADSKVLDSTVTTVLATDANKIISVAQVSGLKQWKITPVTTGTTTFLLRSDQTSNINGILSSIIRVHVSIADTLISLNLGDSFTISTKTNTVVSGIEISTDEGKNWSTGTLLTHISGASYSSNPEKYVVATPSTSDDTITFSVGNAAIASGADAETFYFRANKSTVFKIEVSHISIALA